MFSDAKNSRPGILEHLKNLTSLDASCASVTRPRPLCMPEDALDGPLIAASWSATALFLVLGLCLAASRRPPVLLNALLAGVVVWAFWFTGWLAGVGPMDVAALCYSRLFDGTPRRTALLLFFVVELTGSLVYCVLHSLRSGLATSAERKFFHLTATLIALGGLLIDPGFTRLAAHLVLQIFVIIEVLRATGTPPWSTALNTVLPGFIDTRQESEACILTPMLLVAGVFLPVLLGPPPTAPLHPALFAGVATVGVGDSLAAIVGTTWGRTGLPHPLQRRKTFEGCLALFAGQVVCYSCLLGSGAVVFIPPDLGWLAAAILASTLLEAILPWGDNIFMPLVAWLLLR